MNLETDSFVFALVILLLGIPLALLLARMLRKVLIKRASPHMALLVARLVYYVFFALIILTVLREFGIRLTPLLGAAGVAGIAIGFAAQTSLSNLISGIFLILEKPFAIGDLIRMDNHTGLVHSIDLLSVKLRTFDNMLIRIPNETLIKSPVTTITAFPIRRMDINLGTAFKEDIPKVMRLLREVADETPECLDEPEPLILFKGFGESALEFLLGVWFVKADFIVLRNAILPAIKAKFDEHNIEIPFPHRTLYVGSATDPFPVRVVDAAAPAAAGGAMPAEKTAKE